MCAKTSNTTDCFDMIMDIHSAKTEGEKGFAIGAGFTQDEANKNSYEHYKNEDSSNFVPSDGGDSGECSSGGGGCYVTTACLDALGLPRNSLELIAMKVLTKKHILKSFSGKRDYVAYQRKGPAIASAIQSREDSQGIWGDVYSKLKDVASNIISENYEEAHQLYKGLMLDLEKQFVRQ